MNSAPMQRRQWLGHGSMGLASLALQSLLQRSALGAEHLPALPDGKPHYEHPETNENIRLAGGQANVRYTISDSTHQLVDGTLARPKMTSLRFTRKLELFLRSVFFFLPESVLENIARPKRWQKRIKKIFR